VYSSIGDIKMKLQKITLLPSHWHQRVKVALMKIECQMLTSATHHESKSALFSQISVANHQHIQSLRGLLITVSSRGTISIRKSKVSFLLMAMEMSLRCKVRLLLSSVLVQARRVNSRMNISHAFAKIIGASPPII
jgi:hypothetical protein